MTVVQTDSQQEARITQPSLYGSLVYLEPLSQRTLSDLYRWSTDTRSLLLWLNRRDLVTFDEFVSQTEWRLKHATLVQLIIHESGTETPVGTIFAYDASIGDGYAFGTIYIDEPYRRKRYGLQALCLFIDYLFTYFPLRKLYSDVYAYNIHSLSVMRAAGVVQEGCFREHRYHAGRYEDLYRFSLYARDWPAIRARCKSYIEESDQ
jgi:RimJ/RimL family protein N-acetyltransferase